MITLPWKPYKSTVEICEMGEFVFKRRQITGIEEYEIWRKGKLEYKTFKYSEFIKRVQTIIDAKLKDR